MGKRPCTAALLAVVATVVGYRAGARPWIYRWGSDDDEIGAALPDDNWVAETSARTTRAITIDAPVEMVWPWRVQIGEDRGGFYSYSLLERAVGVDVHNADRIHSEWQDLRTGDIVWLAHRYGETGKDGGGSGEAKFSPGADVTRRLCADTPRREGIRRVGLLPAPLQRVDAPARPRQRKRLGHAVFDIAHFQALRFSGFKNLRESDELSHNLLGRAYLALILPFHRLIVRAMLRKVAA